MPETASLLWGLLFSSIGIGYFIYGRKQRNRLFYWSGIGLMLYPYVVERPPLMIATGVAVMAIPFLLKNRF